MSGVTKLRKILVTGANKGIGYETCKLLSQNSNNQIIAAFRNFDHISKNTANNERLTRIERLKNAFSDRSNIDFVELDIRFEPSIFNALEYVEDKYGNIDVLINNAAIKILDDTLDDLIVTKKHLFNNYFGTLKITSSFIEILNKNGLIIFVASRSGHVQENIIMETFDNTHFDIDTQTKLTDLLRIFVDQVKNDDFKTFKFEQRGYSMSKLAVLAYSKILANQYSDQYAICSYSPGVCCTSLNHYKQERSPINGAKGIELLCDLEINQLMENNGAFWGTQENENNDINSARLVQFDWITDEVIPLILK